MKGRRSFFGWYFTDSTTIFLATWMRVVRFLPWFFSMRLMLRTLFAPWHRDISLKGWRGFNPLKSGQQLLWNIFSRIIGAIVRAALVIIGIVFSLGALCVGAVLFILYFAAPGVLVSSFGLMFTSYWYIGVAGFIVVLWMLFRAYHYYSVFFHKKYSEMDILELATQGWFHRVWERIGIDPSSVDASLLKNYDAFLAALRQYDISEEECEKIISWEMRRQILYEERQKLFSQAQLGQLRPIGIYWHFGYTVHLDQFVEDLTERDQSSYAAQQAFSHESEMELLEVVLNRPQENNALIMGVPGSGRKLLFHELARRIRHGEYDGTLLGQKRILKADFAAAVSHATETGKDPEYEVNNLFHEAAYAGNVILVVENFEQYMDNTRGFSFATILEQYASLPTFSMIAITTEDQFHEKVESSQSLMRHFDIVTIQELTEEHTMGVLFMHFYNRQRTVFTYQALRHIIESSSRYTNTGPLPARALDLAMEVFIDWENRGAHNHITVGDVDQFIQKKTGVRVGEIAPEEKDYLLTLEDHFHERIVGQDPAVKSVAEAVRRMRSGMVRKDRPSGSFLFLGPTGVGKTEMAKTVTQQYFGDEKKIVRMDMSEFQGPTAVAQFIGSRQLNQRGKLTDAVKDNPYGVLLLDEIEKANPNVLDLFLQILDEGFVHDAYGKKINFTTMIIIATSNAGSLKIIELVSQGVSLSENKHVIVDTVVQSGKFRQEFINRFDDVVIFEPITGEQISHITTLQLRKFAARVRAEQNIELSFDEAVAKEIIKRGFDEQFGARSILRYIDDSIADALAKKLISGNIHRGEDIHFRVEDMDL